jgi:hypothetical protein
VLNVILFGLAASSALVIGAVAGAYWTPPRVIDGEYGERIVEGCLTTLYVARRELTAVE